MADCATAADFTEKHHAGKLWFPMICSLKIVRKRNAVKIEDTDDAARSATDDYNAIIVEAAEQDLKQTPTSSSLVLIDLLAARMDAVDVVLPAALHMLEKSQLYSLSVRFEAQKLPDALLNDPLRPVYEHAPPEKMLRPCTQAFCIVQATNKGECHDIGNGGFKVINKGVRDALFDSAAQPDPVSYTLTAFCTKDNLQDFKLDPPRGSKFQYALIAVTDILPDFCNGC